MDPTRLLGLGEDGDLPFVVTRDRSFSRRELLERGAAVAADLDRVGAAGSPVVVSMDAGAGFVAGIAGCWLAGSTPVLLDPRVRGELGRALEQTGARAVISPSRELDALPSGAVQLTPGEGRVEPGIAPVVEESSPVVHLFTSGSTGEPVLVPKTEVQIDVEVRFVAERFGRPARVATLVPWCHIFGFVYSLLVPARVRGIADLSAGISPRILLERAAAGLVDLVVAVPSQYNVMLRYLEVGDIGRIPPSCRFASSGAPLPPATRERFEGLTGLRITDVFGSTEAGGIATRDREGPWEAQPHVEWRIAPGGFLEVRSPSVSAVGPGEFYRMGDLAEPAGAGFSLVGRADDIVKIAGRRISLGEIEGVVRGCHGVEEAVVLAEELRGNLRIVAYVTRNSEPVSPGEITACVRRELADYKVPRRVRVVPEFPRTPAGKVDRRRLKGELGLRG